MFTSLNPFIIRETDANEVILLINRLTRKGKKGKPDQPKKIRKKVYADEVSWF